MHGFFPGVFFFGPLFLFGGLIKIVLLVLLITFIVRVAGHGHRHAAYGHGYGNGYGYGHHRGHGFGPQAGTDPQRIAAWRYASGQIDRAEFDRITTALDASATPPSNPTPPAA